MEPGEDFENVPDIDMVYISAFDLFKLGRVIYHVEPIILGTDKIVDNGLHEVYVNTAVKDDSEISDEIRAEGREEGIFESVKLLLDNFTIDNIIGFGFDKEVVMKVANANR